MGSRVLAPVAAVAVAALLIAGCGKSVTKGDYDKISTGMTQEEVVNILGTPDKQFESEVGGTKTETLYYQTDVGLGARAIKITIQGGKVVRKEWEQL